MISIALMTYCYSIQDQLYKVDASHQVNLELYLTQKAVYSIVDSADHHTHTHLSSKQHTPSTPEKADTMCVE